MCRRTVCIAASVILTFVVTLLVSAGAPDEQPKPAAPVGVREVCEILDAIQAELLDQKICAGGEPIQIGMTWDAHRRGVLLLVYRVPNCLQIYREAYLQNDGVFFLAYDIAFRQDDTHSWIRPITDAKYKELFNKATVRFHGQLNTSLTGGEKARHAAREKRRNDDIHGSP